MRLPTVVILSAAIAGCARNGDERLSADTAAVTAAAAAPATADSAERSPKAHALSSFICVPDSTFRLGVVQVGDSGPNAIAALGTPLSQQDAVEHGMDFEFPVTHYRYRDLAITVTHTTERVAEIQPLTATMRTPLGLYLGMSRIEAERAFPKGALEPPVGGDPPPEHALEAYSCGGRASTVLLVFDAGGHLARLVLNGFYGAP